MTGYVGERCGQQIQVQMSYGVDVQYIDKSEMSKHARKRSQSSSDDNQSYHASDGSVDQDAEHAEFDFKDLPAHACCYCGIYEPNSVVKCLGKNCNKWFCNTKGGKSGNASHIAIHLVKAKHNDVGVHPQSELGNIDVECYRCGNANVFVLGYVKIVDGEDEAVLTLCRMPCVEQKEYGDLKWDPKDWKPLLQNKQFVNIFFQKPPSEQLKKMRDLDLEEIMKIEELWKSNPSAKYEDLKEKKVTKRLRPLKMKYKDGEEYRKIFEALLAEEAQTDKKLKEGQTQNNLTLRFEQATKNRLNAYFMFASKEDFDTSLLPGNELRLSIKTDKYDWSSKGIVMKVMGNQEVCLELVNNNPPPVESGYKVEFVWKSTTYNRMKKGLRRFSKEEKSITGYLYHKILGHEQQKRDLDVDIPQNLSAPGLPKLNYYQEEAVKRALVEPLCLIQGPPGTGKTVTSASIVYQLVSNLRNNQKKGQVLVCAPSNIVVDMLAERISKTKLKVVRFCSKLRQNVSSSVQEITLHNLVRNLKGNRYEKLKGYFKLLDEQKLPHEDEKKFEKERYEAEIDVLTNADVICCTCIASADRRIKDFKFYNVLIDEATQAIEPECLLPMLKSAKQVILVGDHLQLGPVVICRETSKAGLNKSLFERFVLMGHRPLRLQVQYRMHPSLTYFPSNTFYEGTLQNGITESDRKLNSKFPWPSNKPLFFLNLYGNEEYSASGTSYLNRTEAAAVEKIILHLEKSGILANQIGVITPYKGQRAYIINYLQKNGQLLATNPNFYKDIEIASVDGYQGREKDYIIISCVRSNEGAGIGFLTDPRRLNVTITRARYGMIVIGNAKVLYRDNLWNNLLNYFKKENTLVEGSIPNFRQSGLSFPTPQKYVPEKKGNYQIDDTKSQYNFDTNDRLNNFDFLQDAPINSGFRYSALGYNEIPEVSTFAKNKLFDLFSTKKESVEETTKTSEFIIPSGALDLGLDD